MYVPMPMLATAIDAPFDSPDYSFEVKWDGLRCLCVVDNDQVRLYSRNRRDITRRFPELHNMAGAFSVAKGLFDGELCVFSGGLPDFDSVRRRNVLDGDGVIRRAAAQAPALYIVFDVLHLAGEDIMPLPWSERRRRLEVVWQDGNGAVLSDAVRERGRQLFTAAARLGLEGIVAKRHDSSYVPGRRTRHWLKIRHEQEIDCVIGGYNPRGVADIASLALGLYEEDRRGSGRRLVYVGNVGSGFTARARRDLIQLLLPLHTDRSPFVDGPTPIQPVAPRLVCRVAYLTFTPAGHLRHSTFRGLRHDKLPEECTRHQVGD